MLPVMRTRLRHTSARWSIFLLWTGAGSGRQLGIRPSTMHCIGFARWCHQELCKSPLALPAPRSNTRRGGVPRGCGACYAPARVHRSAPPAPAGHSLLRRQCVRKRRHSGSWGRKLFCPNQLVSEAFTVGWISILQGFRPKDLEYQPILVLISVLLTAAAATSTSTSSCSGRCTLMSGRAVVEHAYSPMAGEHNRRAAPVTPSYWKAGIRRQLMARSTRFDLSKPSLGGSHAGWAQSMLNDA